eukprot:CAMPEP_0183378982 /NCGR_PEP_ID=MMETSP0164_2-20130417/125195_1 /TAXON_ID=221442 /ORGANISM="Coccolithus pelagicus ssp braarudi, Strain PLY182g" /LENGTH=652 /DNA_ID=CAMNT_0025556555 /DNA_START=1 /DNA_END=1960 /DNA_ORIENTATION=-
MGVNYVRIYYWSSRQAEQKAHRGFLQECRRLGLRLAVSLAIQYLECILGDCDRFRECDGPLQPCAGPDSVPKAIDSIVAEASEFPDVVTMWVVGNEPDLLLMGMLARAGISDSAGAEAAAVTKDLQAGLATLVKQLALAEFAVKWPDARPLITVPMSFGFTPTSQCPEMPGGLVCDVYLALLEELGDEQGQRRLMLSFQTYNGGDFLEHQFFATKETTWSAKLNLDYNLQQAGLKQLLSLPAVLSEIGRFQQEDDFIHRQVEACLADYERAPVGLFWFSFLDKPFKGGSEAQFGLFTFDGVEREVLTSSSIADVRSFPLDTIKPKPSFEVLRAAYIGSAPPSPENATPPPASPPPRIYRPGLCGVPSCSADVLNTKAGLDRYTCGERITYMMSDEMRPRPLREADACREIGISQFPLLCGSCAPAPSTTPPLRPTSSPTQPPFSACPPPPPSPSPPPPSPTEPERTHGETHVQPDPAALLRLPASAALALAAAALAHGAERTHGADILTPETNVGHAGTAISLSMLSAATIDQINMMAWLLVATLLTLACAVLACCVHCALRQLSHHRRKGRYKRQAKASSQDEVATSNLRVGPDEALPMRDAAWEEGGQLEEEEEEQISSASAPYVVRSEPATIHASPGCPPTRHKMRSRI